MNKYKINNNLIILNNTNNITPINKKKNVITFMPSQPNLNIKYPSQTIKTNNQNYIFNTSSFNNNLDGILSNNIFQEQNKNKENGNNYYNITNNNIYINQFQNIYN